MRTTLMANPLAKKTHPKGPCRNEECYRPFCQGYQLGYEEGYGAGHAAGYAAGYAAGVASAGGQ
jgi:hypothetical protein